MLGVEAPEWSVLFFVLLPLCEICGDPASSLIFLFQSDHDRNKSTSIPECSVFFFAFYLATQSACNLMVRLVLRHLLHSEDQCTTVYLPPADMLPAVSTPPLLAVYAAENRGHEIAYKKEKKTFAFFFIYTNIFLCISILN